MDPGKIFQTVEFSAGLCFQLIKADIGEIAERTCGGSCFFPDRGHPGRRFFFERFELVSCFLLEIFQVHPGEGSGLDTFCFELIQKLFLRFLDPVFGIHL